MFGSILLMLPLLGSGDVLSVVPGCDTTPNSVGPGAVLTATYSGPTLTLSVTGAPPNTFSLFIYSPPINPIPFYNGTLCGSWPDLRHTEVLMNNEFGECTWEGEMEVPGYTSYNVQHLSRDPNVGFGGDLSNGLIVTVSPSV